MPSMLLPVSQPFLQLVFEVAWSMPVLGLRHLAALSHKPGRPAGRSEENSLL